MVGEKSIPEGYKETEVGVIPEDWEVKRLGEVFSFLQTGTNSRSDLIDEGNIQYIHYGDIHTKWDSILDCSVAQIPYIEEKKVKKLPLLREGDLIIVDASEDYEGLGKSIEIKNIGEQKIVAGLHTILLRGNKELVADGFKGYAQFTKTVKDSLYSIATGISVYGISKRNLQDIRIPLPPLPEQKAIAEVLSDIDELIAAIEKLIAKKQKIKQGTMQLLLTGKKRLPGFTGEWGKDKIRDLALITTGSRNTQDSVKEGKYPFFVRSSTVERINSYSYDGEAVLTAGDGVGTGKVFHYINGKFDFHQRVYKISDFDERIDGYFFYMFFSQNFLSRIMSMTAKSSVDSVRMKMITEMEIPLPPLPEQRAIAQILSDMDAEIEALEKKLEKYRLIKAGMMEKLLTGEVRLV